MEELGLILFQTFAVSWSAVVSVPSQASLWQTLWRDSTTWNQFTSSFRVPLRLMWVYLFITFLRKYSLIIRTWIPRDLGPHFSLFQARRKVRSFCTPICLMSDTARMNLRSIKPSQASCFHFSCSYSMFNFALVHSEIHVSFDAPHIKSVCLKCLSKNRQLSLYCEAIYLPDWKSFNIYFARWVSLQSSYDTFNAILPEEKQRYTLLQQPSFFWTTCPVLTGRYSNFFAVVYRGKYSLKRTFMVIKENVRDQLSSTTVTGLRVVLQRLDYCYYYCALCCLIEYAILKSINYNLKSLIPLLSNNHG